MICKCCGKDKPVKDFRYSSQGYNYETETCKKCRRKSPGRTKRKIVGDTIYLPNGVEFVNNIIGIQASSYN